MSQIILPHKRTFNKTTIPLPSSKSESNRVLVIDALTEGKNQIENLAEARDTQTMIKLLETDPAIYDVLDAGTTMRFLTAYTAVTNRQKVMSGTDRMCERPIGILVDALRAIGADIHYLGVEGFPPLAINGFTTQKSTAVKIRGDVSSQYISALLMIAPLLPQGLSLELVEKVGSRTYIEMTLQLMEHFGVKSDWKDNIINISPQKYKPTQYKVESDWSGASYWFSLIACAENGELILSGLKKNSLQGDAEIVKIMDHLGVASEFTPDGIHLTKKPATGLKSFDFSHCPDLAQTVAVTCAIIGQKTKFYGLESLRIKETDRIAALQNELEKIGAKFLEEEDESFTIIPTVEIPDQVNIHTYDDHRMAMAFMPLITKTEVVFDDPKVVNKSYPSFWKHVNLACQEMSSI